MGVFEVDFVIDFGDEGVECKAHKEPDDLHDPLFSAAVGLGGVDEEDAGYA